LAGSGLPKGGTIHQGSGVTFPDDVPTLTDGGVTLRAHRIEDAQGCYEQCQDPLSQQWTTVPIPYSMDDARTFVGDTVPKGWRDGSQWGFAVEAVDAAGNARYAGTMSLRAQGDARAEIAYGAHPWVRGLGIMERASNLMLDWGFQDQGLEAVIWWANKGNWASRKLAWRLGFSMDGTVRQWLPQRGSLLDAWVGGLLCTDARSPNHPWYDVPRILGERIGLRAHEPRDAVRVQEACMDARTRYWFHDLPDPYPIEEAEKYLSNRREQLASGSGISWAVADPDTDELIANISIFDIKRGREAEIGYWTHPSARGRGVMTEACGLVLRHAFVPEDDGGLGLQRVMIFAAEANTASRRIIEANGFVEIGRERRGTKVQGGELVDTVCYDMLASDYAR
jgi:RimJ/RimL family protein N-acetyltransferase